jgi:hypothetical protein
MKTGRKILICFCISSAVICLIGGDYWAAGFCCLNAGWIAG